MGAAAALAIALGLAAVMVRTASPSYQTSYVASADSRNMDGQTGDGDIFYMGEGLKNSSGWRCRAGQRRAELITTQARSRRTASARTCVLHSALGHFTTLSQKNTARCAGHRLRRGVTAGGRGESVDRRHQSTIAEKSKRWCASGDEDSTSASTTSTWCAEPEEHVTMTDARHYSATVA